MREALLREGEVPAREGGVADCFPAVLDVSGSRNVEGDGKVVKGEGEVEAVLWVGGDLEGKFLLALAFEKAGDFVLLVVGNIDEEVGRGVHVAAQDEGLVLDDREGERVRGDGDVFVRDIHAPVAGEVTKEIHGLVEVGDGVCLISHKVVKAVRGVGVDEAVADPLACADALVDVGNDFKGGFDAVFVPLAGSQGFDVVFAREAKHVEGLFAGQGD